MDKKSIDVVPFAKYQLIDQDSRLESLKGLETFLVEKPNCPGHPVVMPTHVATVWKEDVMEILEQQKMSAKDFLVVAAPKTGTHWMWEIMSMLSRGEATYSQDPKHFSWLEYKSFPDIMARKTDYPKVLNTHQTLSQLPVGFRHPDTKIVACMRNPKDVLVSLYHHLLHHIKRNGHFVSFDDMFDYLLYSKYIPFGRTLDHYADIWDNHRNDPNVLIVFYEDIKENTEEMVQAIADHMGVAYTPQLISQVASAVDINSMKMGKYVSENGFRGKFGKDASLYRKGAIGDWRNHFTAEQNEKFDEVLKKWNKERNVPFRFEPSSQKKMFTSHIDNLKSEKQDMRA